MFVIEEVNMEMSESEGIRGRRPTLKNSPQSYIILPVSSNDQTNKTV